MIFFLNIDDEFERMLFTQLEPTELDSILAPIRLFSKNKFRKPIIIMVASLIEHLFNNYVEILVQSRLTQYGALYFLKKYETTGIQSCIEISNSFLDESINNKMEQCIPGFYDKWATFRKLRNDIVHSNGVYISKLKILDVINLVDESITVFSTLIGNIYASNKNNG